MVTYCSLCRSLENIQQCAIAMNMAICSIMHKVAFLNTILIHTLSFFMEKQTISHPYFDKCLVFCCDMLHEMLGTEITVRLSGVVVYSNGSGPPLLSQQLSHQQFAVLPASNYLSGTKLQMQSLRKLIYKIQARAIQAIKAK